MHECWKDWGKVILRAARVLVLLFYGCWPICLEGGSMEPTYESGNIVCVSWAAGKVGGYDRGDVVLFDYETENEKKTLLKRVIAVAGDHLEIDADGAVKVNGVVQEEPYIMGKTDGAVNLWIPSDTVFVMGDHRNASFDSRNIGVIDVQEIQGKVLFRLFPFWK